MVLSMGIFMLLLWMRSDVQLRDIARPHERYREASRCGLMRILCPAAAADDPPLSEACEARHFSGKAQMT